ncbi:hypothetical protein M426DRAFT_323017 [Hypoxylon sp. CI-4A]|nr:hypothetical protein M426DRAFT_323017 [Hypoxylon sp. CI-4A]
MTNIHVKIVSDTVCPWCYIGKKRLDKAIELWRKVYPGGKDDTFTVTWSPFYLDPTAPKKGIPLVEGMIAKFGPARVPALQQRLAQAGRSEGINMTFDSIFGNTRDSHRLIEFGKTKGNDAENRVVLELFKSYFENAGDITSHAMLIEAAEKAGLDKAEAKEWLETGKGGKEVDEAVDQAYAKGIHGVPNFTIQGKYDLGGAQEPEAFIELFAKAKEEKPNGAAPVNGANGPQC